jgi:hypothetical protein
MVTAPPSYVTVVFLRDWFLIRKDQRHLMTWGQADLLTRRGFCEIVKDGIDNTEMEATDAADKRAGEPVASQAGIEHRHRRRHAR